jgi:hypothetical protein
MYDGRILCEETWLSVKGRAGTFDKYQSQEGNRVRLISCPLYGSPINK